VSRSPSAEPRPAPASREISSPWPFASHLDVGAHQLVNLALFGITSFGLVLVLSTIGARYRHRARTALISTLDTPLAPLWVWVAFNERPALTTVVGGVIILAAAADIAGIRQRVPCSAPPSQLPPSPGELFR
jgi:drug/metabolite transporter (DMT)-like permease